MNHPAPPHDKPDVCDPASDTRTRLRLLSYNIQAGIASTHFGHYVTQSWKYVLPHQERWSNLNRLAANLREFDLVGIQESDAGSLRTSHTNVTQFLAKRAAFPFWVEQTNRDLGGISRHGNALLSRLRPATTTDEKLPGMRGRGVLIGEFGATPERLGVLVVHLSLGPVARHRQVSYLIRRVRAFSHAVVMGDLNCDLHSLELQRLLRETTLRAPTAKLHTFPSWKPRRALDHILVSSECQVERSEVLDWPFSDHLPVALEISLPARLRL